MKWKITLFTKGKFSGDDKKTVTGVYYIRGKKQCIKAGCLNGGISQFHISSSEPCKNSVDEKIEHVGFEAVG